MAATFAGSVKVGAPAVVDTSASQGTGAVQQGIGLVGADGAAPVNAQYIGGAAAANVRLETDANVATPP